MALKTKTLPAHDRTAIENYLIETYGVTRQTARKHIEAAYDSTHSNPRKFSIQYWDGQNGQEDTITIESKPGG